MGSPRRPYSFRTRTGKSNRTSSDCRKKKTTCGSRYGRKSAKKKQSPRRRRQERWRSTVISSKDLPSPVPLPAVPRTRVKDPPHACGACSKAADTCESPGEDPVQLAQLYVLLRNKRGEEITSLPTTGSIGNRAVKTDKPRGLRSNLGGSRHAHALRMAATCKTLTDMCDAVAQHSHIQDLQRRIAKISIPGRPHCEELNTDALGFELKMRLASQAPVFKETYDETGLCQVTAYYPKSRHVPIYEIDDDQDVSSEWHLKMKKIKCPLSEDLSAIKKQAQKKTSSSCNSAPYILCSVEQT